MNAKYICYKNNSDGIEFLLFPKSMNHNDVAWRHQISKEKILSAGFCNERGTWGESVSLGVKSRPEDQQLFESRFEVREY